MRERLGRVMTLFIMLMMLAGPMVRAQEAPATPEGETAPVTETVDTGASGDGAEENEGTPADQGNTDTGQDEGTVTEPSDPVGEQPGTPDPSEGEGDGSIPDTGTDGGDAESPSETPEPAGTPEDETATSSPETQVQNRGVTIQATRTLVVTVTTSDGAPVPVGTTVCVWNNTGDSCQPWAGPDLTFAPSSARTDYGVEAPWDSGYVPQIYGSISVPAGQTVPLKLVLQKKATVEITLAPANPALNDTRVCLDESDEGCQYWQGTPLTFTVKPGEVQYEVYSKEESGYAEAFGTFTVAPGEELQKTVTLEAPGIANVTVVTADGGAIPDNLEICLTPSRDGCIWYEDGGISFNVTPGEVTYSADPNYYNTSAYRSASGAITVAPSGTTSLTITLEPKAPAKLNVYVSTEDRQPVPAGTKVCVDMPEPEFGPAVNNQCQTVSGSYVSFATGQGEAEVTVTPPVGSGYAAETSSFWPRLDETTRAIFSLERNEEAPTGQLKLTVSTEDSKPLTDADFEICIYEDDFMNGSFFGCGVLSEEGVPNADGSVTIETPGPIGTFKCAVVPIIPGYGAASGSFTITPEGTATVNAVLPLLNEQTMATLVVNLVTVDGSPVPYGAQVCAFVLTEIEGGSGGPEDFCRLWVGQPESFQIPPNLAVYAAMPSEDGDYFGSTAGIVVLAPGETREVTITIYPEDLEAGITHTVSNENPKSGETVTYTIHAWGQEGIRPSFAYEPSLDFEISNVLPVELSDVGVSCTGSYTPSVPGACYELDSGVLTIFGEYGQGMFGNNGFFDITVTVTGTVIGEPGTVVESTACLVQEYGGEGRMYQKMASTNLYGLAMAQEFPLETMCATASLTIAPPDIEPSPSPSPIPTETATPAPTGTVTPEPTGTSTPQPTGTVTPQPTDPATPVATATPQSEKAVTALPKTGNGAGTGSSLAIYAGLAAAILLGGAGLLIRSRQPER